MKDLISVVMPAYNHEAYVGEAIASVLDQEGVDLELIVVDDCSTDRTRAVAEEFLSDPRVKVLHTHRNGGPCAAMNLGIAQMKGKYLALLDADDYFLPGKLKKQLEILTSNPQIGAVFTMPKFINEKGEPSNDERLEKSLKTRNRSHWEWAAFMFRVGGFALSASILIRRESLDRTGWMDPIIYRQTDIEFHARLVMSEEVYILNEPLYAYRRMTGVEHNSVISVPAMTHRSLDYFERHKAFLRADTVEKVILMFPFLPETIPTLMTCREEWDETIAHFLIGSLAVQTDYTMTMAFGLEVLANLLMDKNKAEKIERIFRFTPDSLRQLSRKADIFSLFEVCI